MGEFNKYNGAFIGSDYAARQFYRYQHLKELREDEAIKREYRQSYSQPNIIVNVPASHNNIVEANGSKDIILRCRDCGSNFVFTSGEQKFYASKGFTYPTRCKHCRDARKGITTTHTTSNNTNTSNDELGKQLEKFGNDIKTCLDLILSSAKKKSDD